MYKYDYETQEERLSNEGKAYLSLLYWFIAAIYLGFTGWLYVYRNPIGASGFIWLVYVVAAIVIYYILLAVLDRIRWE